MGLSEKAIKAKKEYNAKYAKENLKRIPLNVQISEYEEIKRYADQHGLTVNGFIKEAIRAALNKA